MRAGLAIGMSLIASLLPGCMKLAALENLEAPTPIKRDAATARCRVLQSFATDYRQMSWDGAPGDVMLLPPGLEKGL